MENNKATFRIGKRNDQRENIRSYGDTVIQETFRKFLDWCNCVGKGKFSEFDVNNNWAYCSYECVNDLFAKCPSLIKEIDWSYFGINENLSQRSMFWMGSVDSFTDCHYDTYGCNLVCQIRGYKRWLLFPPSDTSYLYPTRLPYEESSVYSAIDFNTPDLIKFPRLIRSSPMVVTLEPGDALLVPRHWWHFVKTVQGDDIHSCSMSVNLWLDDPIVDNDNRVREALSKAVTYSFLDSSFFPVLPNNYVIDKDEFLSCDWGDHIVKCLNQLLIDNNDDEKESQLFSTLLTDFDGEPLELLNGADYFRAQPYADDRVRIINGLDVLDAFTSPDVIEAVCKVLRRRFDD